MLLFIFGVQHVETDCFFFMAVSFPSFPKTKKTWGGAVPRKIATLSHRIPGAKIAVRYLKLFN